MSKPTSERQRDASRKRAARKRDNDLKIPELSPESQARRAACETDIFLALQTYFPHKFSDPFTDDRRAMVDAIVHRAKYGGDQAIAAPRGEGKTTIAEAVTIICLVYGVLRFPVIVSSTGPDAERILSNIKFEFETNELLAVDFPEISVPITALAGAPQRANAQTVNGRRTMMRFSKTYVVLPIVGLPDTDGWRQWRTADGLSRSSGSVLMTRGLDGAIRGIRMRNLRPDMVLIDDPETRESAQSAPQTQDRENTIEQDIAGLGGPGKRIARVMLCTAMNRRCLAWEFTDPQQKSSWNGKRYKLLVQKPTREDLWDEYVHMRQRGQASGEDKDGRAATQYYADRRVEMDAGAVLSNPHRFIRDTLRDGTPIELSALQHCYNIIADRGWDNFATELQNEPPAEESPQDSGISAVLIQTRTNGYPHRLVPEETVALTAGIDVGKWACHYAVIAWQAGATGKVIDYGVQEVYNSNDIGPEVAILHALHSWREDLLKEPYHRADGAEARMDCVLVDAGNWDTTIYKFCTDTGGALFRASKGFGAGYKMSPFSGGQHGANRMVGEHWYVARQPSGVWLHGLDSDHWKRWVHDRFLTPPERTGSLSLFGDDARRHQSYAKHCVAEVEKEQFMPGKGVKRFWDQISKNNHWFDATYMACAAASMLGISITPTAAPPVVHREPSENVVKPSDWINRGRERW